MKEYIVNREKSYAFEMGRFEELQELIRCKDCKHWRMNTQFCSVFSGIGTSHRMPPDGYCSEAERKEE